MGGGERRLFYYNEIVNFLHPVQREGLAAWKERAMLRRAAYGRNMTLITAGEKEPEKEGASAGEKETTKSRLRVRPEIEKKKKKGGRFLAA